MILGLIQTRLQMGRTGGGTITIEPISDMKKSIVYVDGGASGYLTDEKTLVVERSGSSPTNVSWTVIELGGAV